MKDGKGFIADGYGLCRRMAGVIENANTYLIESNHDIRFSGGAYRGA